MDGKGTTVSLVICTRNRARALSKALASVDVAVRNSPHPVELILVNNGSSDDTAEVARAWAAETSVKTSIINQPNPGLSRARNTGLGACTGDIIVFTDDDCCLSEHYFPELAAHYDAAPGLIVLGGRVELGDPADLPLSIKTVDTPSKLGGDIHPGAFLLGANMTLRRGVIDVIGTFDERFGAGAPFRSGEDTEYLHRAMLAGIPVEYVPDMVVYHYHGRKLASDIKDLHQGYDFGTGAIYAKYWRSRPTLHRHFYWMARNGFNEFLGGPRFNEDLGISHRDVAIANLKGFVAFCVNTFLRSLGRERSHVR